VSDLGKDKLVSCVWAFRVALCFEMRFMRAEGSH
jgi:hypothetical protein